MSRQPQPSFRPPEEEEPAVPLDPDIAKARNVYIRDNITIIEAMKNAGKSKEEIDAKVPRFIKDYPALYKMLMKGGSANDGSLKTMLAMLEKMGEGQLTQHQASVIVGQRLHDVFIKPKMDQMERKEPEN